MELVGRDVGYGCVSELVLADELQCDPLHDPGLVRRVRRRRQIGVGVHVDDSRGHGETGDVDDVPGQDHFAGWSRVDAAIAPKDEGGPARGRTRSVHHVSPVSTVSGRTSPPFGTPAHEH